MRAIAADTPLPAGVARLDIVELFWSPRDFHPPPGSLAEELARQPDGRRIVVVPAP